MYINFKYSINFIFYCILGSLLIVIGIIDYKHTIIPDKLVIFGLIIGLIYKFILSSFLELKILWLDSILGLLMGGGFFMFLAIIFMMVWAAGT